MPSSAIEQYRSDAAARLAAQLGIDDAVALCAAAYAVWSNLNPQMASYDRALSVASVAILAYQRSVVEAERSKFNA